MKRFFTPIAVGLFAVVAAPAVALAQDAIVTVDLNMRAGPSTAFPVVDVVPGRTSVDVHGCVAGYSWCDVSAVGNRGWVYAGYLSYAARGSYVPLVEYVTEIDVPILSFSVGSYWDSYYRNRPWYGERTQWGNRWQANWRDIRRDRRDDRVERRIDRRDDRRDDSRGVRVERRTDQREAAQERRTERRVNRVERRRDRSKERADRPRGEQRQMQRQGRSAPRSGNRGDRSGRGGRDG